MNIEYTESLLWGLKLRNFIFIAAVLALAPLPALAEESCTLKRLAVIPFETDQSGRISVPAAFAGRSTRLLLDTGAYWSAISEDLAKSLNLKIQTSYDIWMVDASGEKMNNYVTVPEMMLGDIAFTFPMDFFIERGKHERTIEQDGGIIGLNFLARMDLEIDNAGKTISLFSQDHCRGAGVYWADEAVTLSFNREKKDIPTGRRVRGPRDYGLINMPVVAADLEGETVRALFDTGASVTSIDIDHAKRRWGIEPGLPGVERAGIAYLPSGNVVELYKYTFKSLTVSGIRFENVPVHLGKFDDADLVIGMRELRHLRLFFAFKDGMIHVTAADAKR